MLNQVLNTTRIAAISSEIEDIRGLPTDLLGLQRVPVVDCEQDEIWMRLGGRTISADIITDGAPGVLKSLPQTRLEQEHVPNIKGGRALNQRELDIMARLEGGGGLPGDYASFNSVVARIIDDARRGVQVTMNMIIWGMLSNSLTYDKGGFKVTNFNWGTPSDLVVTPATLWSNTAATPVTDINALVELGRVKYGQPYNRITLSTTALRNAAATTQFQTLCQTFVVSGAATVSAFIASSTIDTLKEVAGRLWGCQVEVYDDTYDVQAADGAISALRFLPVNRVVLDYTQYDGNRNVWDFGNAPITEAYVSSLIGAGRSSIIGTLSPGTRGPVCYAEGEMNPPQISIWGVAKGFARKHKETASAVLIVG